MAVVCGSLLLGSCASTSTSLSTSEMKKEKSVSIPSLWSQVDAQGLVNYHALVDRPEVINSEYEKVTLKSPDSHPEDFPHEGDRFAYWLNAYNVAAIYGVTKIYPIQSVRDHRVFSFYSLFPGGGFFAAQKFTFGGERYSLYALENRLIRKRFDDPRLHFGLNCASISCPDLARKPFAGRTLDRQLDRLTRRFVNSPKGVQIDEESQEIRISAIFDWYAEDFDFDPISFIAPYFEDASALRLAQAQGYRVVYLPYDWSLNAQR